jgi:acylglycerol lipase
MLLLTVAILLSCSYLQASDVSQEEERFFSLVEIKDADKKELGPLDYVPARDAIPLAYRSYLPQQAKAILIFYHGAGAHSGLSYNHIAVGLRDDYQVAVYTPDIRGHGASGGDRGDAPAVAQVWSDINILVNLARARYPELPIFLGGHSGGAGLALNYSSWDQRLPIDGYVFLAPYFGFRSNTEHDASENRFDFTTVDTSLFIANAMSGGKLEGHAKAVIYNYPNSVLEQNPEIVPFNTVNMSNAVTPSSPATQLLELKSFGLWIGSEDEAFDPVKVTSFAEKNSGDNADNEIEMVEGENHFSIFLKSSQLIGPWILDSVE